MKIGIDVSSVIYPQFGAGVYVQELVRHLVNEFPEDTFVCLGYSFRARDRLADFVKGLPPGNDRRIQAKIYPWPVSLLEIVWNWLHLVPVEKLVGKVDLFHASDWVQPPTRLRCVTTVHDLAPWVRPETLPKRIVINQKKRLGRVKRECGLIIADSQATKNDLVEILGIDSERIRVVYLGVDHQRFRPDLDQDEIDRVCRRYQLTRPYLLTLGTRNPRKNLERVIQGFALARERNRELTAAALVIAGQFGWGREIQPQEGINLTGYINPADLPAVYAGAKAFVYPSLYEGFGLPVLEALATGTLVVTSSTSSLPEVGGEAAWYVNPERIEEIAARIDDLWRLSKPEEAQIRRLSLAQAQKFSWSKCAQATHAVYQELIGEA